MATRAHDFWIGMATLLCVPLGALAGHAVQTLAIQIWGDSDSMLGVGFGLADAVGWLIACVPLFAVVAGLVLRRRWISVGAGSGVVLGLGALIGVVHFAMSGAPLGR